MGHKDPGIFHHIISHQIWEDAPVLDAVTSEGRAHVFLAKNLPAFLETANSKSVIDVRSIGKSVLINAPENAGAISDLTLSVPQPERFAGLNTIVGLRNGQPAEVIGDWLRWHCDNHGLEAALILDRAKPGTDPDLEAIIKCAPSLKALGIVQFDYPLGAADLPAERHPYCAPDAPGKDRMQVPDPDPWSSPLGQLHIIELLRRRYLSQAKAVAFLDVSDLLDPTLDASIFDLACDAKTGAIALFGQKLYPWRVRNPEAVHFSDHLCQPFDAKRPVTRWCIAPNIASKTRLWRPFSLPGVTRPETGPKFFRHMGLRHQADAISKIVPKSALVESPQMLDISRKYWRAKPVRVPKQKSRVINPDSNSVAIVTCMKNEGPFILEWLAYHRAIGVERFLVYTNDCTDGTDSFLDLLQSKGLLEHRDNPFRDTGMKPQHAALHAAERESLIQDADWIVCMDVDEFINVKTGAGTLRDLFDAVGDANMISMTWRLFGNSDIHTFEDSPITSAFTRCAIEMARKPHQAWGFKTLYRNQGIFRKIGVHRPKGLNAQFWEDIKWVNGSGKPIPKQNFRNAWRSTTETVGYDLVSLNHYAVRSAESFLVKRDRGRVNHVDRDQGLAYWFRMNHNVVEDHSIQRMRPALDAEMNALLADPEIAAQHSACVAAHREKINALLKTPNYASFYETLTSPRMERLSRLLPHFGANVFLAGPDVVPDDLVFKDHPKSFFFTVERQETNH